MATEFGPALRYLRTEWKKWTLAETAEKSGMSLQHISDLEQSRRGPTFATAYDLAKAFQVPLDAFVSEREARKASRRLVRTVR